MRINSREKAIRDVQESARYDTAIQSSVDTNSKEFQENEKAMKLELSRFETIREPHALGGSPEATQKHLNRKKMPVRDRIKGLIDKNSYFLELSPIAGHDLYDRPLPSGGIVTGIGEIHGKECMIVANDATVMGGVYFPITAKKHLRAQKIAAQNKLPCIYLTDSGGAMLEKQDEVFPDEEHFGRIFYNQARMSADNIPQICAVMGYCTAGGAYIPAMADESIIVKDTGTIFLAGPPLVKAAIGQEISANDLGGANVHTKTSGVADHWAESDPHALSIVRNIINNLPDKKHDKTLLSWDAPSPIYDPQSIYGVIPKNPLQSYNAREVIARIVDGSQFDEFKKNYGINEERMKQDTTLVCGTAKLYGQTVGILANNGILDSEAAKKGTEFIQNCCRRKIPLIFLQNTTGYQVGRDAEHGGIAKDGAKMVNAVSCANVPKFTVITGGSYGAGNYGMCGRAFNPNFLWMWPNAKIAVMGPESAVNVMYSIKAQKHAAKGSPLSEDEIDKYKNKLRDEYNHKSHAIYASANLWDDGIIDPAKTREVLGHGLSVALNTPIQETKFGHFRM